MPIRFFPNQTEFRALSRPGKKKHPMTYYPLATHDHSKATEKDTPMAKKTLRLTKSQKDALLGRGPFTTSTDDQQGELEVWIWGGRNDVGKRVLEQLEVKGLARADGREDGFLTYKLTE